MSAFDDAQRPPSLQIRELSITNFRTFVERTTIPFCDAQGNTDAIAVLHGDNGSGKSNALAALDLFFQTAVLALRQTTPEGDILLPWDQEYSATGQPGDRPIVLGFRERPVDRNGPTIIEIVFVDSRIGRLQARFTPSGNMARVNLLQHRVTAPETMPQGEFFTIPGAKREQLLTWLQPHQDPESRPIMIINARRAHRSLAQATGMERSLMTAAIANSLYALSTSRAPKARETWRDFTELLSRFESLRGKEVSIEFPRLPNGVFAPTPEIVIEDRGRTVLGLNELSSGEQHIIVLCAASLLARTAILAIEEPEISLDTTNQRLLYGILRELFDEGAFDQIILESHVAHFDGPNVIRFSRDKDGTTRVTREPSQDAARQELERLAAEKGARPRWVTRDGYTQLPEQMTEELGVPNGGRVWFLKGQEHWEAWHEGEVDDLFRGGDSDDD